MQVLLRYLPTYSKLLLLIAFIFFQKITLGQKVIKSPNTPQQKAIFQQKVQNPVVSAKAEAKPTMSTTTVAKYGETSQTDYIAWLKSKESCESKKTMDESGCVIIKFSDGGSKRICGGSLTSVTTPNGRTHPIRQMGNMQYVMKLDPPNNPQQADISYKWISAFNSQVLGEIGKMLKTENELNRFLSRENSICKGNIYKQLEYRTIFVQEFLKAQ